MYNPEARKVFLTDHGYEYRTTAWRPDVAAEEFRNVLDAVSYKPGKLYQCTAPSTPLRFDLLETTAIEDQLLHGETFKVYKVNLAAALAWGKSTEDGHVGFVHMRDLSRKVRTPTHFVSAPFTPVLPRPNRQAEPIMRLCLNARVTVDVIDEKDPIYARIGDGMWIFIGDIRKIGDWFRDPVTPLLPFVDFSSYVWGHNDGISFDCSGLTQGGWKATGRRCYRDAVQQERDPRFGNRIVCAPDLSNLRAYDQVHWPHHTALMVNSTHAMHAKGANTRRVVVEPIAEINRWRVKDEDGCGVSSVKRLLLRQP